MQWEAHYTRIIEAEDFFDAVEKVKKTIDDVEEVMTVCPFVEEDIHLTE